MAKINTAHATIIAALIGAVALYVSSAPEKKVTVASNGSLAIAGNNNMVNITPSSQQRDFWLAITPEQNIDLVHKLKTVSPNSRVPVTILCHSDASSGCSGLATDLAAGFNEAGWNATVNDTNYIITNMKGISIGGEKTLEDQLKNILNSLIATPIRIGAGSIPLPDHAIVIEIGKKP